MTIFSVGVRLQSGTLTSEELASMGGRAASRSADRGTPVSSRQPAGPVHQVSTVVFKQAGDEQELGPYIRALAPLLTRIAAERAGRADVHVDLSVAVSARPLGFVVDLDEDDVTLLAAAGCGLMIDVYNDYADTDLPDV